MSVYLKSTRCLIRFLQVLILCLHPHLHLLSCLHSSQILSTTSVSSTAPQKGKDGADSESLEVKQHTSSQQVDNLHSLFVFKYSVMTPVCEKTLHSRTCARSSSPELVRTPPSPTTCTGESRT